MENKKNKSKLGCLGVIVIMMLLGWILSVMLTDDGNTAFEDVGYFKSNTNYRIFTVHITSDSITDDKIIAYGNKKMHTDDRVTHVFFYHTKTPNISNAKSFDGAYNIAINYRPYLLVSIYGDGKTIVVDQPKE